MLYKYNLVAVIGPTASGKTVFAAHLAHRLNGEVISADSRQVYRHMDLGTGKDYSDYCVSDTRVPYHLIDIADPGYKYSVFEYQRDFYRAFLDIQSRGRLPVLCGGSGMYIDAAIRGYRLTEVPRNDTLRQELRQKSLEELTTILSTFKSQHNVSDVDTPERAVRAIEIALFNRDHPDQISDRPAIDPLYLCVQSNRTVERSRITERLEKRLKQGMVEEVGRLLDSGLSADSLAYYGLEYRFITGYLTGRMDYQTMVGLLNTAIHQFAKRQRTWFRRMEREGCKLHWIDGQLEIPEKIDIALQLLTER